MKIHTTKVTPFREKMGYLTVFRDLVSLCEKYQFAIFLPRFTKQISAAE
jgi:hypothetical protein